MTRRVGFGDEPSGGGGASWMMIVAILFVLGVAIAVFDQPLFHRLTGWAFGAGGATTPVLLRGAIPLAVGVAILWVARARFRGRDAAETEGPVRGRRAPSAPASPGPAAPTATARPAPRASAEEPARAELDGSAARAGGCFAIVFLIVWLCGWTAGIVFAIGAFWTGFASEAAGVHWFLLIWIAFALVGWVAAFRVLWGMIRAVAVKR